MWPIFPISLGKIYTVQRDGLMTIYVWAEKWAKLILKGSTPKTTNSFTNNGPSIQSIFILSLVLALG